MDCILQQRGEARAQERGRQARLDLRHRVHAVLNPGKDALRRVAHKKTGPTVLPPALNAPRKRELKKPALWHVRNLRFSLGRATQSTEESIIANRGRSLTSPTETHPPFAQFQGRPRKPGDDLMNFQCVRYQNARRNARGIF